jgi:hypothetical protein
MPVLDGKWRKRSIAASNPPADPPIPTIGQLDFAVAGSGLAFTLGNFLPLVFFREEDALDIAFRFAAMRAFYVSLGPRCIQAAIVNVGTRYPQRVACRLRLCRLMFAFGDGCSSSARPGASA